MCSLYILFSTGPRQKANPFNSKLICAKCGKNLDGDCVVLRPWQRDTQRVLLVQWSTRGILQLTAILFSLVCKSKKRRAFCVNSSRASTPLLNSVMQGAFWNLKDDMGPSKEVCSVQPRVGSHLFVKQLTIQIGKIKTKWKCWQSSHRSLLTYKRNRREGTSSPQKVCPWLIYATVPQGLERNASFFHRGNLIAQTSFGAWEGPDQKPHQLPSALWPETCQTEIKELPVAASPQKRRRAMCASRRCARLRAIKGVSSVPGEECVQDLSLMQSRPCLCSCRRSIRTPAKAFCSTAAPDPFSGG